MFIFSEFCDRIYMFRKELMNSDQKLYTYDLWNHFRIKGNIVSCFPMENERLDGTLFRKERQFFQNLGNSRFCYRSYFSRGLFPWKIPSHILGMKIYLNLKTEKSGPFL